ncbi:winged helix-turn-helix domain-containing protein [Aliarcobacter butzleri]|uniref:winged helix-turn-helix domain-containing protein n=1 Tax=Aliarcobacter butzleri TaxID=28197 RepID=UPI002B24F886|nr:winged helix-turn-helix domain-containing protein [Aliarcobacter butzleri]
MKAIRILVLESNDKSISQIIEILRNNDFLIDICSNNDEFLESIYYNLYDLYLLNINEEKAIPRFQLIKLLNECHDMTMKMVIASISSMIKPSFISGCDECVIRNVDEDEIILRIKALIRRQFKVHSDFITLKKNIKYGIFNKKILVDNDEIILGEKPLLILDYLLKFRDIFVSSEDLEKEVYPACSDSKNGVIRFHIHKIRQLLGNDIILSNRVSGYKINI